MKGLIIQKPWIDLILRGEKIWEMRPRSWSHRGPLALIEKGSGKVVGTAIVVDCLPPLTPAEMHQHFAKHRIPEGTYTRPDFKWFTPLVLADVRRLNPPVSYKHKNGAQNPVNLDPDAEREVLRQQQELRLAGPFSSRSFATIAPMQGQATRSTNEPDLLVVDIIVKGGGSAAPRRFRPRWISRLGVCAAIIAVFCQVAFSIHLFLGLFSESISALAAFKWLIPMFAGIVIASLCGQDELLASFAVQPAARPRGRRR